MTWAQRLKRVFAAEIEKGEKCGEKCGEKYGGKAGRPSREIIAVSRPQMPLRKY